MLHVGARPHFDCHIWSVGHCNYFPFNLVHMGQRKSFFAADHKNSRLTVLTLSIPALQNIAFGDLWFSECCFYCRTLYLRASLMQRLCTVVTAIDVFLLNCSFYYWSEKDVRCKRLSKSFAVQGNSLDTTPSSLSLSLSPSLLFLKIVYKLWWPQH